MNAPGEPGRTPQDHRHNFVTFAVFFVLSRVGWVFKTETVIMPAFLDSLGAGPVVRGWLPVLSRFGNSLPQFFLAQRLHSGRRIKRVLAIVTILQAIPWLFLGWLTGHFEGGTPNLWIGSFLVGYSLFWIANGMALLTHGALQGKLIEPGFRGRLLGVSNLVGCGLSAVAVYVWMVPRLRTTGGAEGYSSIFLATGVIYLATAGCALLFREPESERTPLKASLRQYFRDSCILVLEDAAFRRFLAVITLFDAVLILFPHFASYGIEQTGADAHDLAIWVIVQNVGAAVGGAWLGPIADRKGNRVVLQLVLAVIGTIPLASIALAHLAVTTGVDGYWIVFALFGFQPVSQRIITHYLLELSPPTEQARYLATFQLWQLLPLATAPLVGWLIEVTSIPFVFTIGSALLLLSAFLAGRLHEPRKQTTA